MKKSTRRKFDKAFKLEVVKRSYGDINLKTLSEEFGIQTGLIYNWRKVFTDIGEHLSFPGNGNQALTDEQLEIKKLNKALKEKDLELEILKKAIGIFSAKDRIYTDL